MTFESWRHCGVAMLHGVARTSGHAALALGVWLVLLAGAAVVRPPVSALLSLGPSQDLVRALPPGSALVGASRYVAVVRLSAANEPGALYAHGAWLVLPVGWGGCAGAGAEQ